MAVDYDLVIVGGSAVGRYAAAMASRLGARIALVEPGPQAEHPESTRWHHHTVLQAGQIAQQIRRAPIWGWGPPDALLPSLQLEWQSTLNWAQRVTETLSDMAEEGRSLPLLAAAGVDVVVGQASFQTTGRKRSTPFKPHPRIGLRVNERLLWSRHYLLAPATQPHIPQIEGLSSIDYLTLDSLWQHPWPSLPSKLAILGGDPRAIELAQAFNYLGLQVTLIVHSRQLLPGLDPEVSYLLQAQLEAEGITVLTQTIATHVSSSGKTIRLQAGNQMIETEALLLAIGQTLALDTLNLDAAGVAWGQSGIRVNRYLQTSHPRIYACGEALGGYAFPHLAQYEATLALQNSLSFSRSLTHYEQLPWVVFTDPAVARIGLTETQAKQQYGEEILLLRHSFKALAKSQLQAKTTGFCKLIVHRNGDILGAHLLGTDASEWISTIALALQHRLKIGAIAQFPCSSPSFAEILHQAAQDWQHQTPQQRSLRQMGFSLFRAWT